MTTLAILDGLHRLARENCPAELRGKPLATCVLALPDGGFEVTVWPALPALRLSAPLPRRAPRRRRASTHHDRRAICSGGERS